jgi:hypothetical protein
VKSEGDSPDTVTASGRPVAVPPWGRDRLREYQPGRQKEVLILSNFTEPPVSGIKVEGEYPSFRMHSVHVDETGSPTYQYGIPIPEQRPPLVKGTPKIDETSQKAG